MSEPRPESCKHTARRHGRDARRDVPAEERPRLAAAAAERFLGLPETRTARVVLAYQATAEEIDPAPAIAALRERGVAVALPRVSGPGQLSLHRTDQDTPLVPGRFGILEPPFDAPVIEPGEIDIVIVPGVAFDSACRRVGHGGGYYDRLLANLGRAVTVGLAFDEQLLGEVACDAHDICVDVLVTPIRTLRANAPAAG